mmetsp:Transcript_88815/g.177610  ORF Transcript_88815/g.177610 Transcript_88815/m.177610 type:complete len:316 (+) Transcript_88815:127-1074(+)
MYRFLGLLSNLVLASAVRVIVTGAGGKTGRLIFSQLKSDFEGVVQPVGLVRSKKAAKALRKANGGELTQDEFVIADVTKKDEVVKAMAGSEGVILCTSAVPKIKPWSILKLLVKKKIFRRKDAGRPEFKFSRGGTPEEVDWLGAKLQIDAAVEAGVKRFVFVSSMGGTQPDNFLNSIGRHTDGSGGDIILWKRKAERYLAASGLDYTIIHPGGLVDSPGGKRKLAVGVDDVLLDNKFRQVPRADVARMCCAAVADPEAAGLAKCVSFDLTSKPEGEGNPTLGLTGIRAALAALKGASCNYNEVLSDPRSISKSRD